MAFPSWITRDREKHIGTSKCSGVVAEMKVFRRT